MAITPERNDIDISKLFVWGKDISLVDNYGQELKSLYMRIISDEDLNRARVFALRKSSELRKKLKTPDSDERVAFILEMDDFLVSDLIETILVVEIPDMAARVFSTINFPFPKEPKSDAPLDIVERYQEEIDTWEDRRSIAIREELNKLTEQKRKEYQQYPVEKLYKIYESTVINDLCQKEMVSQFKNFTLVKACFEDAEFSKPTFETVDDVTKLPRELKEQLIDNYNKLDISTEELKK